MAPKRRETEANDMYTEHDINARQFNNLILPNEMIVMEAAHFMV